MPPSVSTTKRDSTTKPDWPIPGPIALCALASWAAVLLFAAPVHGQRSAAYRPSSGVGSIRSIEHNFGRVGGYLGGRSAPSYGSINSRNRNVRGRLADMSGSFGRYDNRRSRRRPGAGQADLDSPYNSMSGYGAGVSLTGRTAGGRGGGLTLPSTGASGRYQPRPQNALLSAFYRTTLQDRRETVSRLGGSSRLGLSGDYLDWVPLESGVPAMGGGGMGAGVLGSAGMASSGDLATLYEPVVSRQTTGGETAADDGPKHSLSELVGNHLTSLRHSYTRQAWQRFEEGDYLEAMRLFTLVENAGLDSPEDRADAKLAMVYAGIASGEYASAANALRFLCKRDAAGRMPHADAFNRLFAINGIDSVGQLYVSAEEAKLDPTWIDPEYLRHIQMVEAMTVRNPESSPQRALLAVAEWGRGRRTNAIFEAAKINDPALRLSRLAEVMREAERLRSLREGMQVAGGADTSATTRPAR